MALAYNKAKPYHQTPMEEDRECIGDINWDLSSMTHEGDEIVIYGRCRICEREFKEVWHRSHIGYKNDSIQPKKNITEVLKQ